MSHAHPTRDPEIQAAVWQVLEDSLSYLYPAAIRVAVRLNIPDHLKDGPKTSAQLAEQTGVRASFLHRILRFLVSRGLFREDDAGAFHLTPTSQVLRSDVPYSMRSMALGLTDQTYWRSSGRLEDVVRQGRTVFPDIFGAPIFEYLRSHEETAQLFHTALADLSAVEQEDIVESYDFPEAGTVVDVGGGSGGFLRTVLTKNPGLRGVLYEVGAVLGHHQLDDPAIAGRWATVEGDFFQAVPTGGDVYVLKRVLHDWDDTDSVRILTACREAMTDRARLLIIDTVVPVGAGPHPETIYDIAMMPVFGGRERTEPEFHQLLAAVDLKLLQVIPVPGPLSIIEVAAT